MSISPEEKTKIIEEYRTFEQDTGSLEVQVALLSDRIKHCTTSEPISMMKGPAGGC